MPANFDLGDNYQIDEDSNGDLVITDGSGNTVIKHDNSASEWTFEQTVKATPSPTESNDVAIKDYVDSVAQGLDWQDSVIDEQNTPPSSPSTGDRYLVDDSPTRDWSGHPNEIAEWDGSQWAFSAPNEAWSVFLEDVDLLKVYDNTNWVAFGSAIDHGALAGLADDDHTQYLLVDGTRAMSGGLDMGNNAISNASSVSTDSASISSSFRLPSSTETISSGDIPYSSPYIVVNGEGGSADTLNNVTGASDGDIVVIQRGDADITVSDGTGNIRTSGTADFTLQSGIDSIVLMYAGDTGVWFEIARMDDE